MEAALEKYVKLSKKYKNLYPIEDVLSYFEQVENLISVKYRDVPDIWLARYPAFFNIRYPDGRILEARYTGYFE